MGRRRLPKEMTVIVPVDAAMLDERWMQHAWPRWGWGYAPVCSRGLECSELQCCETREWARQGRTAAATK